MWEKNAFGGIFHARFEYVKEKHGSDGLIELLKRMQMNGYTGPMNPEEFKMAERYPLEYSLILFNTYRDMHGDTNFDRMGREVAKRKGIVGFFVRWANTPEKLFENASEYWPNFYDFGEITGEMVGERKGRLTGRGVSTDPLFCRYLSNYYLGILESIGLRGIRIEHTKCQNNGDDVCQWDMSWGENR